jgi:hypothetical protein
MQNLRLRKLKRTVEGMVDLGVSEQALTTRKKRYLKMYLQLSLKRNYKKM